MSLLALPLDHLLANLVGIVVCLLVMVICVCRLDFHESLRWRLTLAQIMLMAFAVWAFGTLVDLARGSDIGYHGAAAGLGILIYLLISYRQEALQAALLQEARSRQAAATQRRPHWGEEEDRHAGSTRC